MARVRRCGGSWRDDEQDEAGEQSLGLLVPMRFADLAGRVVDEGVGDGGGILGEIEAVGVETVERIVSWRRAGPETPKGSSTWTGPSRRRAGVGDARVLAFGVDAEDGALGREQVRDDGADALAGSGWSEA